MSKRGAYERRGADKRPAPKESIPERLTKLEGRLDALALSFEELTARMAKVEVAVAGPKDVDPEPPPPFR